MVLRVSRVDIRREAIFSALQVIDLYNIQRALHSNSHCLSTLQLSRLGGRETTMVWTDRIKSGLSWWTRPCPNDGPSSGPTRECIHYPDRLAREVF